MRASARASVRVRVRVCARTRARARERETYGGAVAALAGLLPLGAGAALDAVEYREEERLTRIQVLRSPEAHRRESGPSARGRVRGVVTSARGRDEYEGS